MSTIEKNEIVNSHNLSSKFGLFAGIGMTFMLLLFQLTGNDYSPVLKLSSYLFLMIAIVVALNMYKNKISGDVFIRGIGVGTKLSLVAGLCLAAINIILFLVLPQYAFSKYGMEPHSLQQMFLISVVLFFETLIIGSIMTFIVLQFLKDRIKV